MVRKELPDQPLPEYHDRLLMVRLQADLRPVALTAQNVSNAPSAPTGAGMEPFGAVAATIAPSLSWLVRSGMVRRVVPVPRQPTTGFVTPAAAIAASFVESPARGQRLVNGTSLVELEKGVDMSTARQRIADDAQVQFVSRVPMRYITLAKKRSSAAHPPSAPLWNLRKIEWAQARAAAGFRDATSVKVAVLDTGIDRSHPDLKRRVSAYVYRHADDVTVAGEKDLVGHGTHVAGTIGATIGNRLGIDGICSCDLRMWKIFTDQPEYIETDNEFAYIVDPLMYARALADCSDEDVDAVNLSIGGPAPPDPQELQLFNALSAAGTVACAAMGNERAIGSPVSYPAAIQDVVAVGATSVNDVVASFSNRGDHIALCAPGRGIWSTLPTYEGQFGFRAVHNRDGSVKEGKPIRRERNYDAWDGTSMACPHVTAAVALLLAKKGHSGPQRVKKALQKSADKVAGMDRRAFHPDYGAGRLNVRKLLK